jgi:hypothetical protein
MQVSDLKPCPHYFKYARGCCRKCYTRARNLIRKGETSWEALEKAGITQPLIPDQSGMPGWKAQRSISNASTLAATEPMEKPT